MSKENVKKMVELARMHVEAGGIRAAELYYRMILKAVEPATTSLDRMAGGEANAFFAARAVAKGRHGEACDWYQRAVFADPLFVDYRLNFIIKALMPMGMFKNAKIEAERVTRIEPENPDGWRALALCCAALNDEEGAAAAYDMQVKLDPDNDLAWIDRAVLAVNVGDYDKARVCVDRIGPGTNHHGEALHMLGLIAYRESRHEDAIALYKLAMHRGVQDPEQVKWNMSLALHAIGEYREGFELAEARGRQKADQMMRVVMNRFTVPALTPEELTGEPLKIHVHHEMGNGDAIAMARYLPMLTDLGHEVTLETMDSMVDLFARSFPGVRVVPRAIDYPGSLGVPVPMDRQITTLSLPYLFGTTVSNVPWHGPYLTPDPALVAKYAGLLRRTKPSTQIGLCWSSGIREDGLWISRYGKAKSMHFNHLNMMRRLTSIEFVNLQIGPEREQHEGRISDVLPRKPSWDETAALVANLDMVVTVDTAVAHLAGAMGKPTLLLMQKDGATWHFMCERPGAIWNEASPWYPSIRIFRQKTPGGWSEVVSRAAEALAENLGDSGSVAAAG